MVILMEFQEVLALLEEIEVDRTVPRNVRSAAVEVKKDLKNDKLDKDIRVNNAISILDEVSGDPNIPIYTRTQIWNIVSVLEAQEGK
ncbi:hypothetical protein CL614_01640 [archaeon]|nr:hypothetical protein [archaeon]|tara:strand:+ start:92 stop:352 length:261 start_codon:yes stop_codon:yes gene_type:complete